MLSDYLRSRRSKPSVLVIDDNEDHQLLIGYSLRTKMPQVHPVFASTVQDALFHLQLTYEEPDEFPVLVLLNLCVSGIDQGWYALTELRTRYPRLPVIVLSSYQDPQTVAKAYELGANSFMNKPLQLEDWEYSFQILSSYWFGTVRLPVSGLFT